MIAFLGFMLCLLLVANVLALIIVSLEGGITLQEARDLPVLKLLVFISIIPAFATHCLFKKGSTLGRLLSYRPLKKTKFKNGDRVSYSKHMGTVIDGGKFEASKRVRVLFDGKEESAVVYESELTYVSPLEEVLR